MPFTGWTARSLWRHLIVALLSSGKVSIVTRIRDEAGPSDWWNRVWDFVHTWWGGYFPAGRADKRRDLSTSNEDILRRSKFPHITRDKAPYSVSWTADALVQYTYSTSKACPGVLAE